MAQVRLRNSISTISGTFKREGQTFSSHRKGTICKVRSWYRGQYPDPTHLNEYKVKMRKANELISSASAGFIADLRRYTVAYNTQHQPEDKLEATYQNLWCKAFANHDTIPADINEVETQFGSTLTDWIVNGILPKVRTPHQFVATLIGP